MNLLQIMLAHGLIRPWVTTAAPPAYPPAPTGTDSPQPIDQPPISFGVAAVSDIDVQQGAALAGVTLATISTAVAGVTVEASKTIPGLTFALTGSPPTACTMSGTPTAAAAHRVHLTYFNAQRQAIGGSWHNINVLGTAPFVIGFQFGNAFRRGTTVDTTQCSPTIGYRLEGVVARPSVTVVGSTGASPSEVSDLVQWEWLPGDTSAGHLRLRGNIPSSPTPFTHFILSVDYVVWRNNELRVLGTSTHNIYISEPWAAPPPDPAPVAAPPAPALTPSPTPAPSPVSGPIAGGDGLLPQVLMLNRMNRFEMLIPQSSTYRVPGEIGPELVGQCMPSGDHLRLGANQSLSASVPWDFSAGDVTVEVLVQGNFLQSGFLDANIKPRLTPLVTFFDAGSNMVWALCMLGTAEPFTDGTLRKRYGALFLRRSSAGVQAAKNTTQHTDSAWRLTVGAASNTASSVWLAGDNGTTAGAALNTPQAPGGTVRVGGSGGFGPTYRLPDGRVADVEPVHVGAFKELRITAAQRYTPAASFPPEQVRHPFPAFEN